MAGHDQSGWAPLRHGAFREMWTAQFASNVGGWMQTVGAQWLMLSLTTSASFLALIQTAASLPVLLLAIPAGAIGDLADRRRLLLGSELFMLLAAALLGVLALAGLVTPWALLALLFLVGAGQAWTSPTWQTLQPELVPEEERTQAIALGSVNQNLARAVGPALGGALVAITQPGIVFLVNAATFLAVIAVVWRWRGGRRVATSALPREHLGAAIRASGRYVLNSPALRVVLLRAGLFVFFASAVWALLPSVAASRLHLSSGGYGLLLGCVGIGAVAGAALLPLLRTRLSPDRLLLAGSLGVALAAAVMAVAHVAVPVAAALVVAGLGWILVLATLNSGFQTMLPRWLKARGMGVYLIVFQGGNAIGSAVIGLAAGAVGVRTALLISAAAIAAGPLVALWRPFPTIPANELLPASDWPTPRVAEGVDTGPVMVSIEYQPARDRAEELIAALQQLRRARRRTGAIAWSSWRDAEEPTRIVEQFVVGSWDEHLRQHERTTVRDQARLDHVLTLAGPDAPRVTHWLAAGRDLSHTPETRRGGSLEPAS